MNNLVPIRIKITRKMDRGQMANNYPDFNKLNENVRSGMDWAHFIDTYGYQMHYDRQSGFGEIDDYNDDPQCQYCATLVPEVFARSAVEMFPDRVELMNEDQWENFYDNRAHAHEPEEVYDVQVLQALAAKKVLGIALTDHDIKCLDPNCKESGIRKNEKRHWKSCKEKSCLNIHPDFCCNEKA